MTAIQLYGNPVHRGVAYSGEREPPIQNLSGLWSRRISQKDRLIYRFDDNATPIYIFAIGGHYDQS